MKQLIQRLEEGVPNWKDWSYDLDAHPFLKYFVKNFKSVLWKVKTQRFEFEDQTDPYILYTDENSVKAQVELDFDLTKNGWVVKIESRWLARYDVPEELYGRDNDMVRYGEPEEEWEEDEDEVSFKDPTSKSEMDKALKKIAKAVHYEETDNFNDPDRW